MGIKGHWQQQQRAAAQTCASNQVSPSCPFLRRHLRFCDEEPPVESVKPALGPLQRSPGFNSWTDGNASGKVKGYKASESRWDFHGTFHKEGKRLVTNGLFTHFGSLDWRNCPPTRSIKESISLSKHINHFKIPSFLRAVSGRVTVQHANRKRRVTIAGQVSVLSISHRIA